MSAFAQFDDVTLPPPRPVNWLDRSNARLIADLVPDAERAAEFARDAWTYDRGVARLLFGGVPRRRSVDEVRDRDLLDVLQPARPAICRPPRLHPAGGPRPR